MADIDLVEPLSFPRGVASPDATTAFVATADGTVAALRLDDGAPAWSSALVASPVLATGADVFARLAGDAASARIDLAVLDATTGAERRRLTLELPPRVSRMAASSGFECAFVLRGRDLIVDWSHRRAYKGGAPPPGWIEDGAAEGPLRGALRYALPDRGPTPGGTVTVASVEGPHRPAAAGEAGRRAAPSHPYRRRGAWRRTSWPCGEASARMVLDAERAPPDLLLEVTPAESGSPTTTRVAEGSDLEPVVTPDGRFLLVRETVPGDGPWRVLDVLAGELVGEAPYLEGAQLPSVLGGRLYQLVTDDPGGSPRWSIAAFDLATSELVWRSDLGTVPAASPPKLPGRGPGRPPGLKPPTDR